MTSISITPARRRAPGRPVALAALTVLALAAPATGAPVTGLTTLTPQGAAATALAKQRVRVAAAAPGQLVRGRLILPDGTASAGATPLVAPTGGFTLSRTAAGRTRTAKVTGLQLKLGRSPMVRAKVNGKRVALLALDLRRSEYTAVAATTAIQIGGTRASLTPAGARALAGRLGLATVRAGLYGVLTTSVTAAGAATAPPAAAAPGAAPGPTAPATTGPAQVAAGFPDPGALARPASAVDVATSALTWQVRDSFVRYINSETAPVASGGAVAGPPTVQAGSASALTYSYGFAPGGGWYDAASGEARLLFKGRVNFLFAGHGIDFDVIDPEVEINGSASRVVATFAGRRGTPFSGRNVLVDLGPAGLTPSVEGTTRTYTGVAGWVPPASSQAVFAGFYAAGDPFGSITTSLTSAS